jgi:aquaporin Z
VHEVATIFEDLACRNLRSFLSLLANLGIPFRVTDAKTSLQLDQTDRRFHSVTPSNVRSRSAKDRLASASALHWPEYLMEAAELALFMMSACFFAVLLEYSGSPARQAIPDPFARRLLGGVAMAATAISIIYSPWGKRSGAHMNPALTLTFLRLKKIEPADALFYGVAQFLGGIAGVAGAFLFLGMAVSNRAVRFAVTQPGPAGWKAAFVAEAAIAFVLALTVLAVSNSKGLSRYTPLFAESLIAVYIIFESPLSGMSMNPARTFGSALFANSFDGLWLYFVAPPIGMLLAAELFVAVRSNRAVHCAKFHHDNSDANGAAAMNLSGSEKKESSASRSPIT